MKYSRFFLIGLGILLASCSTAREKDSIGQLKNVKIDLKDEMLKSSLDNAMQHLANLKNKNKNATLEASSNDGQKNVLKQGSKINRPAAYDAAMMSQLAAGGASSIQSKPGIVAAKTKESDQLFEKRATQSGGIGPTVAKDGNVMPEELGIDLQTAGAMEVIKLYKKFLEKYPKYERRDQVMYQVSRSYEELGDVEESMRIINQIVKEYPASRYIDEFQFRRGEYYFTRRQHIDAEDAYKAIVDVGAGSSYYDLALYKLGWTFYKQDLYQEALHQFVVLLDYKVSIGYDFERPKGALDEKRVEDIFRIVSLTFSNLGGADAIKNYFDNHGKREYAANIYANLGEYYLDKRRYNDAAISYKAFVKLNPFNKVSPHFDMRVNEIYLTGGFPRLVIESYKEISADYGLKSEYWKHFDVTAYPDVLGYVKASLKGLANHYHAFYQDQRLAKDRDGNFQEAMKWYREFLVSFPNDEESPAINFQLADLLLENKWYDQAAVEYEHIAYDYPTHEKAAAAGYAAVYARRESLSVMAEGGRERIRRDIIGSSWKFADTFPRNEKTAAVMGAAVDDIYRMKEYSFAVASGRKLLANSANADPLIRSAALLVIGHSLFDLAQYADAEEAYQGALQLTPENDPARVAVTEFLAASVYKQGEQASMRADYRTASENFLRVAQFAQASKIRPLADFDGATALMQLKEWDRAAEVLRSFQNNYSGHPLQPEVTKKFAVIYKETGKLSLAAAEYERVETELQDIDVRREALLLAADLYAQAKEPDKALRVNQRYVSHFPRPVETALEKRNEIAAALKARKDTAGYVNELKQIVEADAGAGAERSERTRYLAATSALVLAEPLFKQFAEIKLIQPFDQNLLRKSAAMKTAKEAFENLLSYEVGDVTSAVTYYLAEMYYGFSRALSESERPDDLSGLEMEQYELSIEEQAYPFEEKAIQTHEKNLELLTLGVYSAWIEMSIEKLAKLVSARYAKFQESSGFIEVMDTIDYAKLTNPKRAATRSPAVPAAVR